jgi:chemotaxis protein methyltransferase CheR
LTTAIVPGGYLFLGHAETLRGLSQDFHLLHTHGTFYYQRKERGQGASASSRASTTIDAYPIAGPMRAPTASAPPTASWVETVQRSTERIQALAEKPLTEGELPGAVASRAEMDSALELLRAERFGEALETLGRAPGVSAEDPNVLLLRAVLLTHRGEAALAESTCARLLELDELSAGAHYVLALCRESVGDRKGAIEQNQVAAYLDPSFAMPRLHLGLLARRSGDRIAARRELAQAAVLLQREEASRLLLFGGGFHREGLIALCRAEIDQLGGSP